MLIEGQPHFEVEKIIDSNWYYRHLQYKIKYKGYGKEHDEWQFRDDLVEDMGQEALKELEIPFFKEHPGAASLQKGLTTRRKSLGRKVKIGGGKTH